MEAKEKAKQLIESFYLCMPFKDVKLTDCGESPELIIKMEKLSAKQSALICVDQVLNSGPIYPFNDRDDADNFWRDVKEEINKL